MSEQSHQNPPTYDSASCGNVENAIKPVKVKVRTLVIAPREIHGVVMDPELVALAWSVRFAEQISSRTTREWSHSFSTCIERFTLEPCLFAWKRTSCSWKKMLQITDKFSDGIVLGIKEGSDEFIIGPPAGCGVENCQTETS